MRKHKIEAFEKELFKHKLLFIIKNILPIGIFILIISYAIVKNYVVETSEVIGIAKTHYVYQNEMDWDVKLRVELNKNQKIVHVTLPKSENVKIGSSVKMLEKISSIKNFNQYTFISYVY